MKEKTQTFLIKNKYLKSLIKIFGIFLLLLYENIIILIWPNDPLLNIPGLIILLIADIAIGFDVYIRPHSIKEKDEYKTWKIYIFFIASLLFLGLPWIEKSIFSYKYQSEIILSIFYILGICLTSLGGILLGWSRITLGKFGSPKIFIQDNHLLIKEGPYKYVRNPMYLADLLLYGGFAIAFGAWFSFAFTLLALLPMLLGRIKIEEKILSEKFGIEYKEWVKSTKRILPFIW